MGKISSSVRLSASKTMCCTSASLLLYNIQQVCWQEMHVGSKASPVAIPPLV